MLPRVFMKLFRASGLYDALCRALIRDLDGPVAERIKPALLKDVARARAADLAGFRTAVEERMQRKLQKLDTRVSQDLRASGKSLGSLEKVQAGFAEQQSRMAWRIEVLERLIAQNDEDREALSEALDRISAPSVGEHVARKIASAEVQKDPFPHIFVEDLFPLDVYQLLVDTIPPLDFFSDRDPIKQNYRPTQPMAPVKSKVVWRYLDSVICSETLVPALTAKFGPFLNQHYAEIFGVDFVDRARALPQVASSGRLMCRRPGYHLRPHLDPKRVFLTALLYLPRSRDEDEGFGTQIFRGDRPFVAQYLNTYYPDRDSVRFELVKTMPFRWNSLVVFMNSGAAHGAEIPRDSSPQDLERYAYQVYIGPEQTALKALIDDLPEDRQMPWLKRKARRSEKGEQLWRDQGITLVE